MLRTALPVSESPAVLLCPLSLQVASFIFFGLWTLHVRILPYSGQGDGFMIPQFQATLVEKTFPDRPACPNPANARFDCGFYGINGACNACWRTTSKV